MNLVGKGRQLILYIFKKEKKKKKSQLGLCHPEIQKMDFSHHILSQDTCR